MTKLNIDKMLVTDPEFAVGYVQGIIRRTLEANGVTLKFEDDDECNCSIKYIINKAVVAVADTSGKVSHWYHLTREQTKLINAHAALFY
jgi:hypothetical protein